MRDEILLPDETAVASFTEWAENAEPKIRQALTASFGLHVGTDATADALALAWERWDEVRHKNNPIGYVYGIGRNKARRMARRRRPAFPDVPSVRLPHVEPGLPAAVAGLPDKQRVVIVLVHGHEWTLSEVADLLGIAKTSVQNHAERGLAGLRESLGVKL